MDESQTEEQPPNAVNKLIEEAKAKNGWSDGDLAARGRQFGFAMTRSNVARLRTKRDIQEVSRRQVESLALALRVAPEEVLNAFLVTMGYPLNTKTTPTFEETLRTHGVLSSGDKDVLLVLYRFMVERVSDTSTGEEVGGETVLHGRKSPNVQKPSGRSDYVHHGGTPGQLVGSLDDELEQQGDSEV